MLSRVTNGVYERREFECQSLLPRAAAKVSVRRADNFVLVVEHGGFKCL
jgi:hypothetical protein